MSKAKGKDKKNKKSKKNKIKEKKDKKKGKSEWEPAESFPDHHCCCSIVGKNRSVKYRQKEKGWNPTSKKSAPQRHRRERVPKYSRFQNHEETERAKL